MAPQISNPYRKANYATPRADRTTLWLLLLVVVALVIALTFSDTHGAQLLSSAI